MCEFVRRDADGAVEGSVESKLPLRNELGPSLPFIVAQKFQYLVYVTMRGFSHGVSTRVIGQRRRVSDSQRRVQPLDET